MIKYAALITVLLSVVGQQLLSQTQTTISISENLSEISGMEAMNDSTFVAINDSGNSAELFVMNIDGELLKTVKVNNAINRDWEDLARDDKYLYIGDIGNNRNIREDLCVYKVELKSILETEEVTAEKISFTYEDQDAFPPTNDNLIYDAEAITCYNDSILIVTKSRCDPWTGSAQLYSLPKEVGTHVVQKKEDLFIGDYGWAFDAVTSADFYNDILYLITYNRILLFNFVGTDRKLLKTIPFKSMSQMESIVVIDNNTFYVADEIRQFLGGGKMYKITP